MKIIEGLKIPNKYLPKLEWVRDIQYFEGPLLSEYKTNSGEIYALHWCDCSEVYQRWVAVRVTKRSLIELTAGLISIYELLKDRSQDPNLLLLDFSSTADITCAKWVRFNDLPSSYLPNETEIISLELIENHDANTYPMLIDGEWKSEELSTIQRRFMDIYALLFQNEKKSRSTEQKLMDVPWKGGYSSVNFYKTLKENLLNMVSLKAITYASPGYVEFFADRKIGLKVKRNIDIYISNKESIDHIYSNLSKYITQEGFNQMDVVTLNQDQERQLRQLSEKLLSNFSEPSWEWLLKTSSDVFKSTQTARSYYRKIKELSSFVANNRMLFSEI